MDVLLREGNRLFAALDLPDDLRGLLARHGGEVAARHGGRAVPAQNLHVTLDFLGTVPAASGPGLAEAFRAAAGAAEQPVTASVARLRARPSAGRARLCAADLREHDGAVTALADRMRRGLARALGRIPSGDRFWPHVTIARFPRPVTLRLGDWAALEHMFAFRRATLYDSVPSGGRPPRYRPLIQVTVGPPLDG